MNKFLKKGELQIINGGYLSDNEGNPVNNYAFVEAQINAEYAITFAKLAKDKDFKGKKPDSLADLKREVSDFLYSSKPVEYLTKPKKVQRPLGEKLNKEALDFINFEENSSKVEKANNFMQQFNVITDFEKFGLFFEQDIVKLNNIYTIKEITEAINTVIDLLD